MSVLQFLRSDPTREVNRTRSSGHLITVWGCAGSGRSLIATNLAFELASLGQKTLLIDADTYHPSISSALGITEPGPGILAALRLARQSRLDAVEFERLGQKLSFDQHELTLLPGMVSKQRWSEFDAEAIGLLLDFLRTQFDQIVVDVASSLERGLFAPESAASRNQSTTSFIEGSDLVLGCFVADAIGVNRLLGELKQVNFDYWPIANRVRQQVLGRNPERQLKDAIFQLARRDLKHLIPDDQSAADGFVGKAQPLIVCAKNSKLREGIRQLALAAIEASAKLPNREH